MLTHNLGKLAEEDRARKDASFLRDMNTWLSPVDASDDLDKLNGRRLPNTCNWILINSTFKLWLQSSIDSKAAQLLWIHAIPGAGKTFLCSRIVEYLKEEGKTIAYFFCSTESHDRRQMVGVLRTWTWQLLQQRASKSKDVESLYNKGSMPNKSTFTEAVNIFRDKENPIYLVLDALDECEPPVRAEILNLLYKNLPGFKILVTSRNENDISRRMTQEGFDTVSSIKIETTDNESDIRTYLELQIEAMELDDPKLEARIASDLYGGSGGMFLWVRLMCDKLAAQDTIAELEEALEDLPDGLDAIYKTIFVRIDSFNDSKRRNAYQLLQWIVAVTEPLELEEIENMMAINYEGEEDEFNPKKRLRSSENFISDCCGPLVEVGRSDKKVRLVHASVKDFLTTKSQSEPSASYYVSLAKAHVHLARSCLTYLSYKRMRPLRVDHRKDEALATLEKQLEIHPALRYCTLHWWQHVLVAPSETGLMSSLGRFLTSQSTSVHWLQMLHLLRGDREVHWHPGENNWVELFPHLLRIRDKFRAESQERTWLDTMDKHGLLYDYRFRTFLTSYGNLYWPPIAIAALFDFSIVVEEELEAGISPNVTNWYKETPLMQAAKGDSVHSMKILVAHGANVNAIGEHTEHALHRVLSWGGVSERYYIDKFTYKCVPILLEAGIDVHWRNFDNATLTHYVCQNFMETDGLVRNLELILKYGGDEDVNSKNKHGQTPLHIT